MVTRSPGLIHSRSSKNQESNSSRSACHPGCCKMGPRTPLLAPGVPSPLTLSFHSPWGPSARLFFQASVFCLYKFLRSMRALGQLLAVREGFRGTAPSLPTASGGFSSPTRLYTIPALPPAPVSSSADFRCLPMLQAHPASFIHSFVRSVSH